MYIALFIFPHLYAPFPGRYRLHASHPDYDIELRGSPEVRIILFLGLTDVIIILISYTLHVIQVDLRFGNVVADDVFFVSGYDIYGTVVAQVGKN